MQGLISSFDFSALRPKSNPFLQRKWEGIARMSYSSHTVPSSQSSDEDMSPVVTSEFQTVLRTLHLMCKQHHVPQTPKEGWSFGHCCGFLDTLVNWASRNCFTVISPHQQEHSSALPGTSSPLILALLVWLHKER